MIIILFSIDGLFLRAQTSFHVPSVMTSARNEEISFNKSLVISQKTKYKLYKPTLLKGTVLRKLKYSWDLEIALDVADAMFVSLKSRCNAE